jgi:hypothetical protein
MNADQHPLAVDVGDLQCAQFGASDTGRVEGHEDGPVHQVAG